MVKNDTRALTATSGNTSVSVQSQLVTPSAEGRVVSSGPRHSLAIDLKRRLGSTTRRLSDSDTSTDEARTASFIAQSAAVNLLASCPATSDVSVRVLAMSASPYDGALVAASPDQIIAWSLPALNSTFDWTAADIAAVGGTLTIQARACNQPILIESLADGESIRFTLSGAFKNDVSTVPWNATANTNQNATAWTGTLTACAYWDSSLNGWTTKGTSLHASTLLSLTIRTYLLREATYP